MSVTFGLAKSRHFYHILLYMSMCIFVYIYFFYINNTAKGNTSLMLNKLLLLLCRCNSLCLADTLFLPQDTFTFISSSHDTVSWLDHILTTTSGYSILTDACVKTDFITSGHLYLCALLFLLIICIFLFLCLIRLHKTDNRITGVALLM